MPRWAADDLARVTPQPRVATALESLGEAIAAFEEGRYGVALRRAEDAKRHAPQAAIVREILGLAAYRTGGWQQALRELRTYRRMSGDTTHIPIEMDVLRALERPKDVDAAWRELQDLGGRPAAMKEGKVVYGSVLIDRGEPAAAYELTRPRRMPEDPFDEDRRMWYVAARAAARLGDVETAGKLRNIILQSDPAFPGIDELEREIASAPS